MSKRQEKPQVDEKRFLALIRTLFGTGNSPAEGVVLEGRRFVHLERLADGLVCKKCYAILSLLDATGEEKDGLASIFDVKCRNCQAVSKAYCDINQDYSIELDVRRNLLKEPHFGKRTGINGRRILDMELFANELLCKKCNNSILSLLDVVKEDIYGFASIFHIACRVCKEVSNVYTDKQHTVGDGEEKHFNLNTSTVGSNIVIGKDKSSMDIFFGHLEVPTMDSEMYKAHEKEVRDLREKMARDNPVPVVEKKKKSSKKK